MIRLLLFDMSICLLMFSSAWGLTEYRLGGVDGNAWQTALSLEEAGVYVVLDGEGQELRQVPVAVTPYGAGSDTLIDFSGSSIQPRFIDPNVNIVLVDPNSAEEQIPFKYTGGNAGPSTGIYCATLGNERKIMRKMFDGDLTTAFFRPFAQDPDMPPGFGHGWGALPGPRSVAMEFGAAIPINRVRFYPRLGQVDDKLLIEEFSDPAPSLEAFGEDSFADNFLPWFELSIGGIIQSMAAGPCDVASDVLGLRWIDPSDSRLKVLKSTLENLDVVVDLRFPTQSSRYLNLHPFPLRTWEIAEFEVYGEGFVEETVYFTQILDFGQPINWGKIRWSAEVPEETRIEIRTRTGKTPNPNLYFAENTNGDLAEITLKDYIKIDVGGRRPPVYDIDNWSFWSTPYDFDAGQRDEMLAAGAWEDGTPLLSPGPSRYIQIAVKLFSTFTTAPRLDQLSLQFAEAPSAQEVVGEIWPIAVDSFEPTTFTYVARPVFQADDAGFDHLEILTPIRVDSVRSVKVNGTEVDYALFPPEIEDKRLAVGFPQLAGEEDSFKQIEVVFDATVLRFGTEFRGWVFNSADPDQVRQQIRPGNATFRFSGDALAVKTPLGGDLLIQVEVTPRLFTPNGDGINDEVLFSYKLREVATTRPLLLRIYDLAGRLVHELPALQARSGAFASEWDGRDGAGARVPPGTYLYELTLETKDEERQIGAFAVVY